MIPTIQIGLIILIYWALSGLAAAGPTAPVKHSHGGRVHTHPLPAEGVKHQHGNSAPGVLSQSAGSITVQPGDQRADAAEVIHSARQATGNVADLLKGKTNCSRSALDCNVCAVNVQQQFARAAQGRVNWRSKPWRFRWGEKYPPLNVRPQDVFANKAKYLLGIPDKHVQGFVRTNSRRYPFAGSHSHEKRGGIFLVRQQQDGKKYLDTLMKTRSRHPSGVHVLGKYLAYGEQGRLFLKNLDKPAGADLSLKVPGPKANFGGGIGLTKLASGDYLFITTGPGGQDQRPRFNRFYSLQGRDGRPAAIRFMGQSPFTKPAQWPATLAYAENLSLLTECGSGDIYAIHATGEQEGLSAVAGRGYWRLSRLLERSGQLWLQPLNAFSIAQNMVNCSMRASGTVYTDPSGRLGFYCHGYAKNPKGSTLNVLGPREKFYFKVGTPY